MAFILKDRVLETCSAPGTGAVTLLGATLGYQPFSTGVGDGNTCYYCIADAGGTDWEVGVGTYASVGNTLTRTTPISGSTTTPVNFSGPLQNIFVTLPAEKAKPVASDSAPSAATTSDAWFDSSQAVQYNYYTDTLGSQWVDTTPYMNAVPGNWLTFYSGYANTLYFDGELNAGTAFRSILPFTVSGIDGGIVSQTSSIYAQYGGGVASTSYDLVYGYVVDGGGSRQ